MIKTLLFAAAAFGLALSAPVAQAAPAQTSIEGDVIYQIFVRSFRDSNGDGNGDLNGIRQEIPYLKKLGVTTVLLTPLYDSNFYHNYFARDFRKIDPEFGTTDDFTALVKALHRAGIKIVIDVEVQYLTDGNPWLDNSLDHPGAPDSHYVLYDDADNHKPVGIFGLSSVPVYTGEQYRVVMANLNDPGTKAYHLALFKYWEDPNGDGKFDDGIDGLRIDHMMDDLDNQGRLTNLFAGFWAPMFDALKAINPKFRVIAEQADWSSYGQPWFAQGKADAVFGFNLRSGLLSFDKPKIEDQIKATRAATPDGDSIITMVENHDTGRFASMVGEEVGKERVGAAFDILLKGTPLIYYGQEIGQTGLQMKGGTDGNDIPIREALRWQDDASAPGMALWYKDSGPWWDQSALRRPGPSVASQGADKGSLLNFYRQLIALRQSHPALRTGDETVLANDSATAVTWLRSQGGQRILVAVNLSDTAQDVTVDGVTVAGARDLLKGGQMGGKADGLRLAPYGVRVLRLD